MPVVNLEHGGGATVEIMQVDGVNICNFNISNHEEEIRSLPLWKARDDDVLLCAYPRSGSHWILEQMSMLFYNTATFTDYLKDSAMLEHITQTQFDCIQSPRILNSHLCPRNLPRDIFNRRCKIILLFRNPKDVAVSLYNLYIHENMYRYNGTWANYLPNHIKGNVIYGSWFDYVADWDKFMTDNPDYPFHVMCYENVIKNGVAELSKLNDFLGLKREDSLFKSIISVCEFENFKKEKDKREDATAWRNHTPMLYRQGGVGNWKSWFTVAQNEAFDKTFKEKMLLSSIQIRFEL